MRDVADVTGPLVAFLAVLVLAIGYGGALTDAMTPEPGPMYDTTPPPCGPVWVVQSGETLWGIADRCYPVDGVDVRPLVDELKATNPGVTAANLRAGQTLDIPERWR